MKAIKFKGYNTILAEDQPEYKSLPVCREFTLEGSVVCCYRLTIWERIKLLFRGRIFVSQLTFNEPFQPICPHLEWKEGTCTNCGNPVGDHKQWTGYKCKPGRK